MEREIKKQLALLNHGGERGIRTPDTELPYTRFPGVLLQPLGHLTAAATKLFSSAPSLERCSLYRNLTCMQAFFKKFLPEQWLQGCFLVKSCIYKVRPEGDAAKVTLLQTFKVVKTNKPLFIILGIFSMNVFGNIANNLYLYFFTYNMGNGSLVAAVGTITICCSIACLVTPFLTARFRKRDIFIVLCVLEIAARIGFYMSGYDSVTEVIIWLSVVNIIFMMTNPLVSAMIADTVEYSYYHTGKRCAAITFAGQTFTGKLSVAIAGGFSGVLLTILGYMPNEAQSIETMDGIFFCIALLPALGTVVRIILLKMYTFNEEQHAELVEKINRGEFNITAKI